MKLNIKLGIAMFVFCFFLSSLPCLGARNIIVKGMGTTQKGAIDDGLRTAVEQVMGVYLDSKTQVHNLIIEDDTIISKTSGFVSTYKILSSVYKNNIYECKLSVDVESDKDKIVSNIRKLTGNKTFSIKISQYAQDRLIDDHSLKMAISQQLIEKGYYPVTTSFDPFYKIQGRAISMEVQSMLTDSDFHVVSLQSLEIFLSDKSGRTFAILRDNDVKRCTGKGATIEEASYDLFKCISSQQLGDKFATALKANGGEI